MPRQATGGAFESRGKFFARVTIAPKQRKAVLVTTCKSLGEAETRAEQIQDLVDRLRETGHERGIDTILTTAAIQDAEGMRKIARIVERVIAGKEPPPWDRPLVLGGETFKTFAGKWTSGDLARLYPDHIEVKASVQDDIERLKKHVYPHVEDVPLAAFTRAHADGVMAKLPATLKRGTRRQVAQLVNRVLRLAVFAGEITASPLPPGWLPKAPDVDALAKESLLPSEEEKLLDGRNNAGEVAVPLNYRVAYVFLHREGMRKGEAEHLTWGDVDLDRGLVSLDENKTDRPRSWVLSPGVAVVLAAWKKKNRKTKASDPVFVDVAWDKLAPAYRGHCEAVGIDRARLFQQKANKLRLRAHDMRAFFVTAGLFAGRDALWLTDRSGHTTLGMLRTYERDVRRWRELGESPVDAALAIPELVPPRSGSVAAASGGGGGSDDDKTNRKQLKVHGKGVEPIRLAAAEPKSAASASFATRAGTATGNPSRRRFRRLAFTRGRPSAEARPGPFPSRLRVR